MNDDDVIEIVGSDVVGSFVLSEKDFGLDIVRSGETGLNIFGVLVEGAFVMGEFVVR